MPNQYLFTYFSFIVKSVLPFQKIKYENFFSISINNSMLWGLSPSHMSFSTHHYTSLCFLDGRVLSESCNQYSAFSGNMFLSVSPCKPRRSRSSPDSIRPKWLVMSPHRVFPCKSHRLYTNQMCWHRCLALVACLFSHGFFFPYMTRTYSLIERQVKAWKFHWYY